MKHKKPPIFLKRPSFCLEIMNRTKNEQKPPCKNYPRICFQDGFRNFDKLKRIINEINPEKQIQYNEKKIRTFWNS